MQEVIMNYKNLGKLDSLLTQLVADGVAAGDYLTSGQKNISDK